MQSTYLNEPKPYRLLKTTNIHFYAHYHQQVEIAYCMRGNLELLINGLSYKLSSGDCAVIWPNERHFYQPSQNNEDNLYFLLLFYPSHTESFYEDWINKYPQTPIIRNEELPDFFPEIWNQFYTVYTNQPEIYMFKAYTAVITAHIIPQLTLYNAKKSNLQNDTQVVLNYVNQHFTEKITLSIVSHELGISTANLSQIFSNIIGCSFATHVNSLRVAHAKRLLRSSNYSVNEICIMSGFQSKRSFFRNFQNMCGQTPLEYRHKKHT